MLHEGYWIAVKDGDDRARALFDRHYSRYHYADGRKPRLFVGPGEKLVLLTEACDAVWVWRKFIDGSGQQGVNCAVFRNEGPYRASALIREAEQWAWRRWPGVRLYTYVNATAIVSPRVLSLVCWLFAVFRPNAALATLHAAPVLLAMVPGYCFRCARWKLCGETKVNKLLIFEKYPPAMMEAAA
jgi:hypothetical protein